MEESHLDRILRFGESRPMMMDVGIAVGVALLGFAASIHTDRLPAAFFTVAACAPLVVRRRYPRAVFLIIAAVLFLQWLADIQLGSDLAFLVALYTVAAVESRRTAAKALGVGVFGALLAAARWANPPVAMFVGLSAMVLAAVLLGVSVQHRRALLESLKERAARLELERDQQGRLAAAAERGRIAREMHDIVAHNLTVVVALADGAVYTAREHPERATEAMQNVSRTGREALAEMRRLLGVLSDEDSGIRRPQPGVAQIAQLVEQVGTTGVPVELQIEGDPTALPAGVQLAAYRIVQEALTNTLKHGGAEASATVAIRCVNGSVDIDVSDRGVSAEPPAGGSGRGLAGMRQRAAVFGGTVDAGPSPGGGWQVHARLLRDAPGAAL